jgi:hypothetical protein
MTTGWIVINLVLSVLVTALVAGVSVLVPHMLHRRATAPAPDVGAPDGIARERSAAESYERAEAA